MASPAQTRCRSPRGRTGTRAIEAERPLARGQLRYRPARCRLQPDHRRDRLSPAIALAGLQRDGPGRTPSSARQPRQVIADSGSLRRVSAPCPMLRPRPLRTQTRTRTRRTRADRGEVSGDPASAACRTRRANTRGRQTASTIRGRLSVGAGISARAHHARPLARRCATRPSRCGRCIHDTHTYRPGRMSSRARERAAAVTFSVLVMTVSLSARTQRAERGAGRGDERTGDSGWRGVRRDAPGRTRSDRCAGRRSGVEPRRSARLRQWIGRKRRSCWHNAGHGWSSDVWSSREG